MDEREAKAKVVTELAFLAQCLGPLVESGQLDVQQFGQQLRHLMEQRFALIDLSRCTNYRGIEVTARISEAEMAREIRTRDEAVALVEKRVHQVRMALLEGLEASRPQLFKE